MIPIADQEELNARYAALLASVYGGTITAEGRFINEKIVLPHYCSNCRSTFYARPKWLTNGRQPHSCYSSAMDIAPERPKEKGKRSSTAISNGSGKVDDMLKLEMIRWYHQGITVTEIARRTNLVNKTVNYHLKKAGVK